MKKIIALIALSTILFAPKNIILAQEEGLESAPEVDEQEVTENLKERLQKTIQGAQDELTASNSELPTAPRAFVGNVTDIIQETISVDTKDGLRFTTATDETTIVRTPGNKVIDAEDIQIDDFIISMGYLTAQDNLEAKRIIVSTTVNSELSKTTGRGTIESTTNSAVTLQLNGENNPTVISINSSTIIKNKDEIIDFEDLNEGDKVIFTADVDDEDLEATIIMVIKSSLVAGDSNLTDEENDLE